MDAGKQLPSFYEVQRVENGYDTYVVGCFPRRGLYTVGVMDLEDPKAWQGGVSDLVLYFALTQEEYAWLNGDRGQLDELARRIQQDLPQNRFVAGLKNGRELSEEETQSALDSLKTERLDGDEAFDQWKEEHPASWRTQRRTPLTDARHELAEFQRTLRKDGVSDKEKREENRRQRSFANRLLEQDAIYVAMDENSPGGQWPGLEYISGDVHLFTTQENGETACTYYGKMGLFDYAVQKVEQSQFQTFFENCEALGVERFRVDDGMEPVEVMLEHLLPQSEQSWLEEHNRLVRNVMLRSLEVSGHIAKRGDTMQEQLRKNLVGCMATWRIRMLQELGDTLLYVPSALPGELHEQFASDLVFSKLALERLKKKLEEDLRPHSAITGPHFAGRVAAVENPNRGKLPLRLVRDPQDQQWLVAFTSRAQCEAFVENQQEGDTVVVLTLDELYDQVEGVSGLVVDAVGLAVQLRSKEMEQCLTLRKGRKASIHLEKKPPVVKAEQKKVVASASEEEKAEKQLLPNQQNTEKVCEKTKRLGFLTRLFRRKH